jgi:hypothetical protein
VVPGARAVLGREPHHHRAADTLTGDLHRPGPISSS